MQGYHDGLNRKLLEAIPTDARRVLELGCANGRLGQAFKAACPEAHWTGIEIDPQAARRAAAVLDAVHERDIDRDGLQGVGTGFDAIVVGDLLEHLRDPAPVIAALHRLAAPDATLVCCLPNMGHRSVVARLLSGDFDYDDMGLMDRTHLRFFTQASAFKAFLDGGWLPHLQDQYRADAPSDPLGDALLQAAGALGVPATTAQRNLGLYQMIVVARRWDRGVPAQPGQGVPFTVIVPVNRPDQFAMNAARSPGLKEAGAQIVPVEGASSAAQAWRIGCERAAHDWRVMIHQDVYCPAGSGVVLSRWFGALQAAGITMLPVGFAGLASTDDGGVRYAGQVIDRVSLFSHGGAGGAVSIDEFAVAMHRDAVVSPDPELGWHLWGTDLCLQAQALAGRPVAQIIDVPLFHNSTNDYTLPQAFHDSASRLLAKHPSLQTIPTLCGDLRRPAPAAMSRSGAPTVPSAMPAAAPPAASSTAEPAGATITETYRQLQAELHAGGNYGLTARHYGPTVLQLLEASGARTLLDYGCGSHRSLLMGMEVPSGVRYAGYDPAVPQHAGRPEPAELVVCIDVLEHIEHECLDNVLDELRDLCTGFGFFTIHSGAAGKFLADGRNAHLIQEGPSWWLPRIESRFRLLSVQPVPNGFGVIVQAHQSRMR